MKIVFFSCVMLVLGAYAQPPLTVTVRADRPGHAIPHFFTIVKSKTR